MSHWLSKYVIEKKYKFHISCSWNTIWRVWVSNVRMLDIGNVFRSNWKLEKLQRNHTETAKFMGPTWGPSGSCRPQMGPMLVPQTLLSGYYIWGVSTVPAEDVRCYDICWPNDGQICIQYMPVAQVWRPTILRVLGYWLTLSVLKFDWNFSIVL